MMTQDKQPKFNVLIVDDERSNLHTLFHSLRTEYNVITANSGEMALHKISLKRPDIILLDIVMPGMDGYEVFTHLKEDDTTRDIPVIFITGLTNPEDEAKGLFYGAVDYISKPFNVNVVQARVKTHLKIAWQMHMIEQLGMIDALTEIPNRRRFDQQLEIDWARAIREQTPISILMIDIDNFKSYNDTYGHPAGDALLQTITRTVTARIRRPHDLFARIGGEEFAILLLGTDMTGASVVGEGIRADIENLNIPSGMDLRRPVTVSLGVESVTPCHGSDSTDFVVRCDKRLYAAKKAGKNRLVCHDNVDTKSVSGSLSQESRTPSIVPAKMLRRLLNALDAYMLVSDLESDSILFVNDKMKEQFQLSNNIIGQPCHKIMNPCQNGRCEFCVKHKLLEHPNDGQKLETQIYFSGRHYNKVDQLIEWLDGQKVHLQYFIDITELKRTETSLERMAAIVNSSPQFIVYINAHGHFDFINPTVSKMSGYSHNEIMDGGIPLLFDEQANRHIHDALIPEVMEKGKLSFELPLTCRDGDVRILSFLIFIADMDNGGIGAIARDITEQKWFEREVFEAKNLLHKAQENLQTVLDFLPVPVCLVDEELGTLIYANKSAAELFGVESPKAAYARSINGFMPEIQSDGMNSIAKISAFDQIEKSISMELMLLRTNGETFHALVSAHTVDYNGRKVTLSVIQKLNP